MARTDDDLAEVLSEFARTLVTDFPVQGILDHLVRRIVDLLPIDAAGVSLISPTTSPRLIAGSDDSARIFEELQTELGEGPCLAAYESDEAICIPDLATDARFPAYAARARAQGLVAVFTFPLRNSDRCLGALDLYRMTAGGLLDEEMATAQTLADVATAYLLNAEARSAQADLVATVSHELRAPIASISGSLELLQLVKGEHLNQRQTHLVDVIARNSSRLAALADNLLLMSSTDAGAPAHERIELDLSTVISAAHDTLETAIAARSVAVTFTAPSDPVMVSGNPADLEAVVTNLVGNALKFTEDGGWVRCTLSADSHSAHIEVRDNGLGIPLDEQGRLFTRFFRSSTSYTHMIQGTGLGLAIVASIARSHGGDVSVVSDHLKGSTFDVRLPLVGTMPLTPRAGPDPRRAPRPETAAS